MEISEEDRQWISECFYEYAQQDNQTDQTDSTEGGFKTQLGFLIGRHFKFKEEYVGAVAEEFYDVLEEACNHYGYDIDEIYVEFLNGLKKAKYKEGETPYDLALINYQNSDLVIDKKTYGAKGADVVRFAYELSKLQPIFYLATRRLGKDLNYSHTHINDIVDKMIDDGYIKVVRKKSGGKCRRLKWANPGNPGNSVGIGEDS